jgi:hypothetical protein
MARQLTQYEEDEIQQELRRRERIQELSDLRAMLSLESGRRFLWRFIERTNVFRTSWVPNGERIENVFFNEGQRDVGLWLMDSIRDADATLMPTMMLEVQHRALRERELASALSSRKAESDPVDPFEEKE